ncbi:5'-nucleotidase C-terminal domain-containing protein [Mesobacterium sp. TK19101]|uniref:5'-nucleotidase C-terminal domain-containing protein n=1 Tax=Mesobacterium hydrothermale TaxID=3111907 RepID=A0ABU6HJN2_9RHOB|nr:5'-nucleotidase C-terminal domain-containing protein [Mesobacterium sp. TK19101]MEC3862567.1 5'-nucleotidase C-terminal domain-containing protein [Mesobacterium sp. TK19101]
MPDRDLTRVIALTPDGPGARIRRIAANPDGSARNLYGLDGDFTAGPVTRVFATTPDDIPPARPPARRLRVFHVNDMHTHICDLAGDAPPVQRLAQMVERVNAARSAAAPDEAVLFLSAGDDHTGTVLDELVGWTASDFTLDPGYRALSAAGLDVAAIGNHEFDRGAAQLTLGLRDAAFPLLSANVHSSAHLIPGQHYFPALIAEVNGLRVGIIGLTTRVETRVGQASDPTLQVASPVAALTNILPLVDQLADVVIVLSHCGYGDGSHLSGKAAVARDIGEADFALAETAGRLASKPTVIIGAHTHTRLNEHGLDPQNIRHGIPITQAEANGKFLGEIGIDTATGRITARLHAIPDDPTLGDKTFADTHIAPIIAQVTRRMQDVIGTAVGQDLTWQANRRDRYCRECALANFMNDALVSELAACDENRAELAFLNGGSILSGLSPGPVSFGQWFDVMPYSDEVFIVEASGADLYAILQSNARRLLRAEEIGQTDLGGFVARGFLHTSGALRYRIAPGATAAEARATDITLFGQPIAVQLDRRLPIAMTTYLALGSFGERWTGDPLSGGIPGDLPGYDLRKLPRRNTGLIYRNLLVDHIRRHGRIAARCDGRLTLDG